MHPGARLFDDCFHIRFLRPFVVSLVSEDTASAQTFYFFCTRSLIACIVSSASNPSSAAFCNIAARSQKISARFDTTVSQRDINDCAARLVPVPGSALRHSFHWIEFILRWIFFFGMFAVISALIVMRRSCAAYKLLRYFSSLSLMMSSPPTFFSPRGR